MLIKKKSEAPLGKNIAQQKSLKFKLMTEKNLYHQLFNLAILFHRIRCCSAVHKYKKIFFER